MTSDCTDVRFVTRNKEEHNYEYNNEKKKEIIDASEKLVDKHNYEYNNENTGLCRRAGV